MINDPTPGSLREPPSPRWGEEDITIAAGFFSPLGRRWREAPDEGVFTTTVFISEESFTHRNLFHERTGRALHATAPADPSSLAAAQIT